MPTDITDLRSTIIPKSDQLNADQLLGGPLIITVKEVRVSESTDQPVSIFHDVDPKRPFKPCLTMRKVLVHAWGPDGTQWAGRSMELYCDLSVKWGGEEVGGIRISRLTDIPKAIKVSLTATKGKKALHVIEPLKVSNALQEVLDAISTATGREGLKKAREMGEALKSSADREMAVAAYKKRLDAIKELAAAAKTIDQADNPATGTTTPPPQGDAPPTYAQLAERIKSAPERVIAEIVLDDARELLPADQVEGLQRLVDEKWPDGA